MPLPVELFRSLRRTALLRGLSLLGERRRRILAWQAMAAAGVQLATFSRNGLTWRAPVGDSHIGFGLFVEGGFAQASIDLLVAWLRARGRTLGGADVIVDVGANIGSTCIPIVRAAGCRAVAIEPEPGVFALLRENVERNGLADRCILIDAAVAVTGGQVTMTLGTDIGAASVVSEMPGRPASSIRGSRFDVRALPLGDAISGAGVHPSEVALVWADVQGSEAAVIETGEALWSLGVPLWAEFEPGLLTMHGGVERFYTAASRSFDRFIEARRLFAEGLEAAPQDISRLREVLDLTPQQTDVLLLPPTFDHGRAI